MVAPRIVDRPTFREVLQQARVMTGALVAADPAWSLPRRIDSQLELMQLSTAEGDEPDEPTRQSVDVGPIAAREFSGSHDQYARLLMDLHYAFRRYDVLLAPTSAERSYPGGRRGILQVCSGIEVFRKHLLQPGERITLGRGEHADRVLHGDKRLGARHLEICWDGIVCQVRDLDGPGGIKLNGIPALRGEVCNGGVIEAADTILRFFIEDYCEPEPATSVTKARVASVRAQLADTLERGALYAVLDAARSRRILRLLNEAVDPHASLYEGDAGRPLDDVAPYLVQLRADSGLFGRLLTEGWGQAWGIWLASAASPKQVRRSMRRPLMVQAEGRRERMYFRFYDPRVMARFMPLATVRQKSELFAAADVFYFEDTRGNLCSAERDATSEQGAAS